jgi:hypothetical protein
VPAAAGQVTPGNAVGYIEELGERVSSVTTYDRSKLRRASQLLELRRDFDGWSSMKGSCLVMRAGAQKPIGLVLTSPARVRPDLDG